MFIRETCWLWGAEPVTSCRCGHPPGGAIRALCVFISAHFLCCGAAEEGKDQIGWLADNTDVFGFKKNKQLLNLWPLKAFRTKTWFHLITSWFSLVQTLLSATRPMRWIQFSPPLVLHRTRRRWLISSGWLAGEIPAGPGRCRARWAEVTALHRPLLPYQTWKTIFLSCRGQLCKWGPSPLEGQKVSTQTDVLLKGHSSLRKSPALKAIPSCNRVIEELLVSVFIRQHQEVKMHLKLKFYTSTCCSFSHHRLEPSGLLFPPKPCSTYATFTFLTIGFPSVWNISSKVHSSGRGGGGISSGQHLCRDLCTMPTEVSN